MTLTVYKIIQGDDIHVSGPRLDPATVATGAYSEKANPTDKQPVNSTNTGVNKVRNDRKRLQRKFRFSLGPIYY